MVINQEAVYVIFFYFCRLTEKRRKGVDPTASSLTVTLL